MTDVMLVKDCGLYPSYKKIIDFTGTKSEIIQKQLAWLNNKDHTTISDVNYNKFQNKLVLEMDYEEALTYTYAVMQNITGTGDKPMFFFVQDVENLTNGIEDESPNVAISLSLDPIMTYMGDYHIDETMVVREHVDRWKSDSNLPIRITPNIEGSYGFTEYEESETLLMDVGLRLGLVVIGIVKSDGSIHYYGFPATDVYSGLGLNRHLITFCTGTINDYKIFPNLNTIISGHLTSSFNIATSEIISISYYPLFSEKFTVEYLADPNPSLTLYKVNMPLESNIGLVFGSSAYVMFDLTGTLYALRDIQSESSIYITVPASIKPTDNSSKSNNFEPGMFTDPYVKYIINDGIIDLFEIPDNVILKSGGNIELKVLSQISITSPGTLIYVGNSIEEAIGNNCITFIPAIPIEIGNNKWSEYAIASKDKDRELVNNYAIKNAIDNLIYMSYGGALVGSRSASDKPMFYPSMDDYGSFQYVNYKLSNNGVPYKGGVYPGSYKPPSLTPYGKRMAGATGLAAGASIVTSLVDGKIAWENQMALEQEIKNTPSGLLQGGASMSRLKSGNGYCKLVVRKIDSINFDIGAERYFKFGYIVNKHEIPDTQTRKYFNYILTNGAIVKGAINQTIRDVIASIFDAGVTIFHYDSGDNKTRNLEYTDKENIEVSLL